MGGNRIINLQTAISGSDALSRNAGDQRYYQNTTSINDIVGAYTDYSFGGHKITNVADGTDNNDAINRQQLNTWIPARVNTLSDNGDAFLVASSLRISYTG